MINYYIKIITHFLFKKLILVIKLNFVINVTSVGIMCACVCTQVHVHVFVVSN